MLFSAQTGGFYDPYIHGDNVPPDVVEVDHDTYMALLAAESETHSIGAGPDGHPILISVKVDPWPALAAKAQALLDTTDGVALRCFKAGVGWPQEWQAAVVSLRAFLAAKDASAQVPALPSKDGRVDYPAGS